MFIVSSYLCFSRTHVVHKRYCHRSFLEYRTCSLSFQSSAPCVLNCCLPGRSGSPEWVVVVVSSAEKASGRMGRNRLEATVMGRGAG